MKIHGEEKSSFLPMIDLERIHKRKMSRNGYTDTERAHCVLWIAEGYGKAAVLRLFLDKCFTSPPARSAIRKWYQEYQSRGIHAHRSGNGRPRISSTVRNEIRELFEVILWYLSVKCMRFLQLSICYGLVRHI